MTKLVKLAGWTTPRGSVIFVHGLGGHPYDTWLEKNSHSLWPLWLAQDVKGLDVFTLSYPAPVLNWLGIAMPLEDRAVNVLEILISHPELLAQPIIFICHSLGGLVTKQVLREAADQSGHRPEAANLLKAVRGIVFLATPHTGSQHASRIARLGFLLWPSAATLNLIANDPGLRNLNVWYRNWSPRAEIKHRIFYEMQGTAAGTIVAPDSADPGLLNSPYVAVEADHSTITKLSSRDDIVYRVTRTFLTELIEPLSLTTEGTNQFAEAPRHDIETRQPRNYGPMAIRLVLLALVALVGFKGVQSLFGSDVAGLLFIRYEQKTVENEQLKVRVAELEKRLAALVASTDEDKTEKAGAERALRAGQIDRAQQLIDAIELRKQLSAQAQFRVEGDRIAFTNGWDAANIIAVNVPQLAKISLARPIKFHKDAAGQLQKAFAEVERQNLLERITTWCGSYSPRTARSSSSVLSAHALGIAFDLNCAQLPYGTTSGKIYDTTATVAAVMEKYGLIWGGHFTPQDPTHFQVTRLMGLPISN